MAILSLFGGHRHYWGVPIKQSSGENVQVCYSCGKQRTVLLQFGQQGGEADHEAAVVNALYKSHYGA